MLTSAGEPVHGIELVATPRYLGRWHEGRLPAWSASEHTTWSDGRGFFLLGQLVEGEYTVRTQATDRYAAARAVLRAGVDAAVLVVEEAQQQQVHVYGTVENTAGRPLAEVRVLPIGQKTRQATYTDGAGRYGLDVTVDGHRQGSTLRFMREGYRDQRLTLRDSDVSGGEDVRLDVRMEPEGKLATVTGTVTGPDGSPVAFASIQLRSAALGRRYQAGSSLTGDFSMADVEIADDYRLWVRPKGQYKDYIEDNLAIPADGMHLPIVLEPQNLGSLRGWMVDANGNPVPQFSLWLRSTQATVPPILLVTSDQRGYFSVDQLPEGRLSFQTLSAPHFNISGIEVPPGGEQEVQLRLDWGPYEIAGYVLNAAGRPVPGAQVALSWLQDDRGVHSSSHRGTIADARGYFLFTQVGPGLHTLNITAAGFSSAQLDHDPEGRGGDVLVQLDALSP